MTIEEGDLVTGNLATLGSFESLLGMKEIGAFDAPQHRTRLRLSPGRARSYPGRLRQDPLQNYSA